MTKDLLRRFGFFLRRWAREAGWRQGRGSTPSDLAHLLERTDGMISLPEARLLYDLARDAKHGCIIEVGSYRGRSTVALARGSLDGHQVPVYAIDPHEHFTGVLGGRFGPDDRGAFFRAMLDTDCFRAVRLVNLSSELVAPQWNKRVVLLWIDGDHTYAGVQRDFQCWAPHLAPEALIAFDDSLEPQLGPTQLIDELIRSGRFLTVRTVGKITVLARNSAAVAPADDLRA